MSGQGAQLALFKLPEILIVLGFATSRADACRKIDAGSIEIRVQDEEPFIPGRTKTWWYEEKSRTVSMPLQESIAVRCGRKWKSLINDFPETHMRTEGEYWIPR